VEDGFVRVGGYRFAYRQAGLPSGAATLMARPEAIRVVTGGDGLPGRIRSAFFMGTYADYLVETDVGEIAVADAHSVDRMHGVGQGVKLQFGPSGLYLLAGPSG
jgi:ABC-type Fe3+/spermidine/putrescine transport system ATPase subunit